MDHVQHQKLLFQILRIVVNTIIAAIVAFTTPLYDKQAYHTSALSGAGWVLELLEGHLECIHCELVVHNHVFCFLVSYLQVIQEQHSHGISLEQQVAIFLYRCATGVSVCHTGQ